MNFLHSLITGLFCSLGQLHYPFPWKFSYAQNENNTTHSLTGLPKVTREFAHVYNAFKIKKCAIKVLRIIVQFIILNWWVS